MDPEQGAATSIHLGSSPDPEQFAGALVLGQFAPGPNGLWPVVLGYFVGGIAGALLAAPMPEPSSTNDYGRRTMSGRPAVERRPEAFLASFGSGGAKDDDRGGSDHETRRYRCSGRPTLP